MSVQMKKLSLLLVVFCMVFQCSAYGEVLHDKNMRIYPDKNNPSAQPHVFNGQDKHDLLEIWYVSVSVCDSFIVRCKGETMFIDGGYIKFGKRAKIEIREKMGVEKVRYMFNTHHHADHSDVQRAFLRTGFMADTFLTPYERDFNVTNHKVLQSEVDKRNIEYVTVKDGDVLYLGGEDGAKLEFFRWDGSTNANYSSMMLKITYKERSAFFMADVIGKAQTALFEERKDIPWKSDIFKVGHHGYSRQEQGLLQLIDPEICVMTNGRKSGEATYNQIRKLKMPLLMTTVGIIYFSTDGGADWTYNQD